MLGQYTACQNGFQISYSTELGAPIINFRRYKDALLRRAISAEFATVTFLAPESCYFNQGLFVGRSEKSA
jgi:hypothetical protein